jgi:glycosyltransferase involved in cell wall biosynthesis
VIASARGGPAELIQPGRTGLLVETGSAKALADALLSLLRDREAAERMGRAARQFALERLTLDAFTDRMIETYSAMLAL